MVIKVVVPFWYRFAAVMIGMNLVQRIKSVFLFNFGTFIAVEVVNKNFRFLIGCLGSILNQSDCLDSVLLWRKKRI